jgi:hypothetical protein
MVKHQCLSLFGGGVRVWIYAVNHKCKGRFRDQTNAVAVLAGGLIFIFSSRNIAEVTRPSLPSEAIR